MSPRESRPIAGAGGYARPGSIRSLTTVWGQRSECDVAVLVSSVVKLMILEGK
jgi:hypothetical protein